MQDLSNRRTLPALQPADLHACSVQSRVNYRVAGFVRVPGNVSRSLGVAADQTHFPLRIGNGDAMLALRREARHRHRTECVPRRRLGRRLVQFGDHFSDLLFFVWVCVALLLEMLQVLV